jgi:hypothetical protein
MAMSKVVNIHPTLTNPVEVNILQQLLYASLIAAVLLSHITDTGHD